MSTTSDPRVSSTAPGSSSSVDVAKLGKLRRMQRISDAEGFIRTAAIDHPENYQILFDQDLTKVSFDEVVESKLSMIAAMAPHATSLLLDPVWSLGQAVASAALPGSLGLISGLEDLYYRPDDSPVGFDTTLRLKPGWTPAKLSLVGCDAAKLVVFHRHDADDETAARVHGVVAGVAQECARLQLPLIVEPLWYPLSGEDPADPEVAQRRTESVIATAGSFRRAGADIMKVEFPTTLATPEGRAAADDACERLDAAVDGPWVLLTAGVTFDGFADQLRYAARHGSSGFMAGRAIWGDGVGRRSDEDRRRGEQVAADRLDALGEILAAGARRSWIPARRDEAAAVVGPKWYASYGD
jgi:tagatose-1,6-bisphosphate aldolase